MGVRKAIRLNFVATRSKAVELEESKFSGGYATALPSPPARANGVIVSLAGFGSLEREKGALDDGRLG